MSLDLEELRTEVIRISGLRNISYEELMEKHRQTLSLAKRAFKRDIELWDIIKEIKKRALKLSIRMIANGNPLYHSFLTRTHPAIERASRDVYIQQDGKSSVQQLIEDSGCVYYQRHRFRSLKQFLEDIQKIGNRPENFKREVFYSREQGLGRALKNRFGTIGKAVMLTGVDYPQKGNSMTKRERYSYSLSELLMIKNDDSLSEEEKSSCIFNALSLQHYDLGFSSQPERSFDDVYDNDPEERELRRRVSERLSIMLRWIETEDKNWNELLLLNGIGNRFHRTCFYFTGNGSKMDGYRMYMGLDRILGNIGC